MLLPTWLYTGVFYGLLGLGGLALVYYAVRPASQEGEPVPRRPIERWLPIVMLVGGPLGAWAMNHVSHDAIVISDGDGGAVAVRKTSLGVPGMERVAGTDSDAYGYDQLYILNESKVEARVELQSYGKSFGVGRAEPERIPPGKALRTYSADYVGPDDRPPDAVDVEGLEAKFGTTSRTWLTWDRR